MKDCLPVALCGFLYLVSSSALCLETGDTPWMTWGEGSYAVTESGNEEGFKFDGYIEQGYVVSNLGNNWSLVPYVALRATVSENSDEWWNNRATPYLGIEVRKPIDLGNGGWAEVSFGVRAGYYANFDGKGEGLAQAYVGFGAGGSNW